MRERERHGETVLDTRDMLEPSSYLSPPPMSNHLPSPEVPFAVVIFLPRQGPKAARPPLLGAVHFPITPFALLEKVLCLFPPHPLSPPLAVWDFTHPNLTLTCHFTSIALRSSFLPFFLNSVFDFTPETWIPLSFFSASPPPPPTPRHHHLSPVPAAPVSTVSFNFAVRPSLPISPLSIVFSSSSSRSPFFFVVLAHIFVLGPMPGLFQPAEPISPNVRAHPPAVGCPAYFPTDRPKGKYLVPLLLIKVQTVPSFRAFDSSPRSNVHP